MRKAAPLAVEVPGPERDKPAWVKVGVIAAVGFVIGIAWPRLMGVRLGPSAPGEAAAAAASASAASGRAAEAPAASAAKGAAPPASAKVDVTAASASAASMVTPSAAAALPPTVTVKQGSVVSCRTTDGETKKGGKECGAIPALDAIVQPRLRKLASCAGAEGQSGKLSVVVTADFGGNKIGHDVGKSSTVGNLDQLTACVKKELSGISLGSATHEHARYTVAYNAVFAPAAGAAKDKDEPKEPAPAAAKTDKTDKGDKTDKVEHAPGEAAVAWEVALVRDQPKTGEVVARLPRGTKVKVGALKEGWYAIKFGDDNGREGYVYRGAIGR